jgi:hypothetical protein
VNAPGQQFDFIGDIHGHADKLMALLELLGYSEQKEGFVHPSRKVLFVGDYIDRGPQIKETLSIVKKMLKHNNAVALMGNHEYNAICFHTEKKTGGHLRKHSIKNVLQHVETLRQFQNKQDDYEEYVDWFKTLPLFYETENFRAVHSCWDYKNISYLKTVLVNDRLNDDLIIASTIKETPLYLAIEETLKGKEIKLPKGIRFQDKDGNKRKDIRIKWWEDPLKSVYKELSIEPIPELPESIVDPSTINSSHFYSPTDKPVFFGHYWLRGNPMLYRANICCLDYSVAKKGFLAAYRFDNEKELENGKIVFV